MRSSEERIERLKENIKILYQRAPLQFLKSQEKTPLSKEELLSLDISTYDGVIRALLPLPGYSTTGILGIFPNTIPVDCKYGYGNWVRRSLEDMFLLCRNYVEGATLSGTFDASTALLGSMFCWDTGLRVYRSKSYYPIHETQGATDHPDRQGIISSLLVDGGYNNQGRYSAEEMGDDGYYFPDMKTYGQEIKIAEEWVISQPDFAPVETRFHKKELTQSL